MASRPVEKREAGGGRDEAEMKDSTSTKKSQVDTTRDRDKCGDTRATCGKLSEEDLDVAKIFSDKTEANMLNYILKSKCN